MGGVVFLSVTCKREKKEGGTKKTAMHKQMHLSLAKKGTFFTFFYCDWLLLQKLG